MLLKEIVYVHTYKYGDALQNIESLKLKFGYSCLRSRIIVKAARILRRIQILSLSCLVLKSSVVVGLSNSLINRRKGHPTNEVE